VSRHADQVARIEADRSANTMIRTYFHLPCGPPLWQAMRDAGLGQADLVLALLDYNLAFENSWLYVTWLCTARVLPPVRVLWPTRHALMSRIRRPRREVPA
jgi:hypothetical protein